MIQLPRRSVTRFFIPLIDVLILLFGMFILLPVVDNPQEALAEKGSPKKITIEDYEKLKLRLDMALGDIDRLEASNKDLNERSLAPEALQKRLEELRRLNKDWPKRLWIRTMQIDPKDGSLSYTTGEGGGNLAKQPIRDQRTAIELMEKDRREMEDEEKLDGLERQLLYIIQYPREFSEHPGSRRVDEYKQWFKDVELRFDIPALGAIKGVS